MNSKPHLLAQFMVYLLPFWSFCLIKQTGPLGSGEWTLFQEPSWLPGGVLTLCAQTNIPLAKYLTIFFSIIFSCWISERCLFRVPWIWKELYDIKISCSFLGKCFLSEGHHQASKLHLVHFCYWQARDSMCLQCGKVAGELTDPGTEVKTWSNQLNTSQANTTTQIFTWWFSLRIASRALSMIAQAPNAKSKKEPKASTNLGQNLMLKWSKQYDSENFIPGN